MKDTREFIAGLNDLGIKIWTDGDKLRYKVPKSHESLRKKIRSELSARKADIISYLDQNRVARTKHDTIPPRPRECQPVPSPAQQRLWFLSQLEGMNAVYNVVSVYRLVGLLDENALRQALRDLVRRHDSLRLTFPTREGAPRMVKGAEYDPLTVEPNTPPEKSGGPGNAAPAVPDEATARWVNRNAGTPFDLAEGPLFRVHLLNRNDKDHVLVVNIHHIISDAWSMEILVRDICLLYNAYAAGRVPSLDPPSAGYLDYAAWKQDRLGQADHLRRYWMEKLAGAPSLL
ncbi:MAG TPA: hypothetical protein DHV36_25230, partial [Desulfobacteraceae bacterium]|nr:hypothetical protein [Desulfobacteraceae bacterium]